MFFLIWNYDLRSICPMEHFQNPVVRLIACFGGLTATSRGLGHKHPTTVQGWVNAGRIPSWRRLEIEAAAQREGVEIPVDLLSELFGDADAEAA